MRVSELRATGWNSLPAGPGVYWWYFAEGAFEQFQIAKWCNHASLRLRRSEEGRVCLYHGMAKSLSQRIEWHAAQALSIGALRSGFLSTFRFTLLALNGFDYVLGSSEIDRCNRPTKVALTLGALSRARGLLAGVATEPPAGSHLNTLRKEGLRQQGVENNGDPDVVWDGLTTQRQRVRDPEFEPFRLTVHRERLDVRKYRLNGTGGRT